jgi:hypothetical protein
VECAALQRGDAFRDQLFPAIDQTCQFGAVQLCLFRDRLVVRFVGLAQIRGVRVRNRALLALVSSPPEKAMPTFWLAGTDWSMVDMISALLAGCDCG